MTEKYQIKAREVMEENKFKYFIVGSPENLETTHVVKSNNLRSIWEQLWALGEIDTERYLSDYGEERDRVFIIKDPINYEIAIRSYICLCNNFHYNQAKLSLTEKEKLDLLREIVGEIIVSLNNGEIIGNLYSGVVKLTNIYQEKDELPRLSLEEFKKEINFSLRYVRDISIVKDIYLKLEEIA